MAVEGFFDGSYVVEADVENINVYARVQVRYVDTNSSYRVLLKGIISVHVHRLIDGQLTSLGSATLSLIPTSPVTLRIRLYDDSGTDKIAVYTDGTFQLTVADAAISAGGVAFSAPKTQKYDNARIGYDGNGDGDIDDADDGIIWG